MSKALQFAKAGSDVFLSDFDPQSTYVEAPYETVFTTFSDGSRMREQIGEPERYAVGRHVRIINEHDVYPDAIIPAGEVGTIISLGIPPIAPLRIRLDKHFGGLDEWNNELHLYPETGSGGMIEFLDTEETTTPSTVE